MKFNKPIYIGLAVLELSKLFMYNDIIKKHYGDKVKLMYMDTDLLILEFKFENEDD